MLSDRVSGITTHIGLTVPDLDAGRRFYCGILGLRETETYEARGPLLDELTGVPDVVVRTAMLEVPGGARIQMQTFDPAGGPGDPRMNAVGLTHLSFGVRDVVAEHARLTAAGVRCRVDPTPMRFADARHPMNGWTVIYFEDPWGLSLELLGPTPGEAPDNDEHVAGADRERA